MASFYFGRRSLSRLKGIHPDLRRVADEAIRITPLDFVVTYGLRTLAEQKALYQAGATDTMKSRHLTGHALDVAPIVLGVVHWDWPLFYRLNDVFMVAAKACRVPLEWGGDWPYVKGRSRPDGPHFQLPWKAYP